MSSDEQKQSQNQNYDFILNTGDPLPKSRYERLNKKFLLAVAGAFAVLIIIFVMISSTISGQNSAKLQSNLLQVAALQTEIIRVANEGASQAESSQTKARAQAISDGMQKSLVNINSMLEDHGKTASDEELASKQNDSTDQTLKKAVAYGNYDKTLEKLIDKMLLEYQRSLLAAEKSAGQDEKASLDQAYEEANSMLGLIDQ